MLPEDFILGTACEGEDSGRQASRVLPFHPVSAVWENASGHFLALNNLTQLVLHAASCLQQAGQSSLTTEKLQFTGQLLS